MAASQDSAAAPRTCYKASLAAQRAASRASIRGVTGTAACSRTCGSKVEACTPRATPQLTTADKTANCAYDTHCCTEAAHDIMPNGHMT